MVPSFIISMWITGVLSTAVLGGGIYALYYWYHGAWVYDPQIQRFVFEPHIGWNVATAILAAGVILALWSFVGGLVIAVLMKLLKGSPSDTDAPKHTREGKMHRLKMADGTAIQVESYGPETGQPIILTHGWGGTSTEWHYLKRQLTDRYRVIVWDLQGLGLSSRSAHNDYSLKKMASDLDAIMRFAGDAPAILLGHSIGGMILLTYCQVYPEALASRVAGLVLVHTTYLNPLRTTKRAKLHTALEKPLIVPLLHLAIWLSPLAWLMNWLTYLSGLGHWSMKSSGFAGTETWAQVDFMTQFQPYVSPGIFARGLLGMLEYDVTATLPKIPTATLVIVADQDETCVPAASERIKKEMPASQLVTLAPAKHMGLIEQNKRCADAVRSFAESAFGR